MGSAKSFLLAGAITLVTLPAANAADLPPIMPVKAPVMHDYGGWYLRGDIGMTNQQVKGIDGKGLYPPQNDGTFEFLEKGTFDSGWMFGGGIGYQFNSWLRADLTGEYRGKTEFRALDRYDSLPLGSWNGANEYSGQKSEWLAMANLYVDLGTWWSVTPFIGAGVGAANITIHDFRDINTPTGGVATGGTTSKWNFAWAVHAGLAYQVTPGFTVELAYRYLDLGNAVTGDMVTYTGVNNYYDPFTFKDITSHDVKLGIRWMLDTPAPAYSPLMRKG
jgi:opacity protein-like surface antigen